MGYEGNASLLFFDLLYEDKLQYTAGILYKLKNKRIKTYR